jgi:hypothetical protein
MINNRPCQAKLRSQSITPDVADETEVEVEDNKRWLGK